MCVFFCEAGAPGLLLDMGKPPPPPEPRKIPSFYLIPMLNDEATALDVARQMSENRVLRWTPMPLPAWPLFPVPYNPLLPPPSSILGRV